MSNENEILNKILNEYTITKALSKIFLGEDVSTKERKEAMKKAIDIVANVKKANKSNEKEKLKIDIQANAFKALVESINEN